MFGRSCLSNKLTYNTGMDLYSLSNQVMGALSACSLTRRDLLGFSALAAVSFGCSKVSNSSDELGRSQNGLSFERILERLSRDYIVGGACKISDSIVVIFADNHEPSFTARSVNNISNTHAWIQYQHLLLEGYIEGPGGGPDKKATVEISKILREAHTIAPEGEQRDLFKHGSYNSLFGLKNCLVTGMEESTDSVVVGHLSTLVSDIYALCKERLRKGDSVDLEVDRTSTQLYRHLVTGHSYLQQRFDEFPPLPAVGLGETIQVNGELIKRLTLKDVEEISKLGAEVDEWTTKHVLYPRSQFAAKKMAGIMNSANSHIAALSIGWLHTFNSEYGPSIQTILKEEGISYIILDLVDLTQLRKETNSR